MWAITPKGVGYPPAYRKIRPGFDLAPDETFTVTENPSGKVLASDGLSLVTGEPPLDDAKAEARQEVIAYADRVTAQVLTKYPEAERAAWPQKQAEAVAFLADGNNAALAPLIAGICDAEAGQALSGQAQIDAVTSKANAILAKATEFATIAAAVEALRVAAETGIASATSRAGIEQALLAAKAAAGVKAMALGLSVPG
ncbi:MAG: hypothetical protein H6874_10525 [Hyphomicrobiaceae bacterium]|nr:hypothetical protein [Hyphomicrobiaceae bacterium]